MQNALSDAMCVSCDIRAVNVQATMRQRTHLMHDDVAHAFNLYQPDMVTTVTCVEDRGARMGRLSALTFYLRDADFMGPTPRARALMLRNWNEAFGLTQNTVAVSGAVPGAAVRAIVNEVYDTGTVWNKSFMAFCGTDGAPALPHPHPHPHPHPPPPSERIGLMRARFIRASLLSTSVYNLIHVFHQHHVPTLNLNENRAVDLYWLHLLGNGPGVNFTGFADWGPGNHDSIAANKTGHFDKHVLDCDKAGLDWKAECRVWWQTLNIALSKQVLRARVPIEIYCRLENLFPQSDTAPLPLNQVTNFLAEMRIYNGWDARILNWFRITYEAPYVAIAVNGSANMSEVMVHTTAGGALAGVYISGRFNQFFIIGRLNFFIGPSLAGTPTPPVLGISSCYVAQNMQVKLGERMKIWPLV